MSQFRKIKISPSAIFAPAFLPSEIFCLVDFSCVITLSASFEAIPTVLSVLPPSDTIIS
jgi:hypothetical protein